MTLPVASSGTVTGGAIVSSFSVCVWVCVVVCVCVSMGVCRWVGVLFKYVYTQQNSLTCHFLGYSHWWCNGEVCVCVVCASVVVCVECACGVCGVWVGRCSV